MPSDTLLDLAKVRPWGTILLGRRVRCDGVGSIEEDVVNRKLSCYSHIHADHIAGFHDSLQDSDNVLVTKETLELLIRWKGPWLKRRSNLIGVDFHHTTEFRGDKITLLPSGHMLGSAQILVESNGIKAMYSGDFNMPGATTIDSVDVLVLDATHGEIDSHPHPHTERQLDYIERLVSERLGEGMPVLVRSHRGKLQYLMHHLRNRLSDDIMFVSDVDGIAFADAYGKFAMPCGRLVNEASHEFYTAASAGKKPYVRFSSLQSLALPWERDDMRTIRVGTRPDYSNPDKGKYQISLSDHADYDGIMRYVSSLNPRLVLVDNTRASESAATGLAEGIRDRLGIEAIPQGLHSRRN